jgi:signal transduction histidine kinase
MHKLITNLLDVYAIEEGRFASNLEKYDFEDLVKQCVEHNQGAADRKTIEIRMDTPGEVFVRADSTAASQVLDNLISNAVKYSPLKTTVTIQLVTGKDHAEVRVCDKGPGISVEDQKRLFQKFSRLSAVPTAGESSTGLGLAIAKRLAEAMGGTVEYQSASLGGSVFILRLPLWPEEIKTPVLMVTKTGKTGKVKMSIEAREPLTGTQYVRLGGGDRR